MHCFDFLKTEYPNPIPPPGRCRNHVKNLDIEDRVRCSVVHSVVVVGVGGVAIFFFECAHLFYSQNSGFAIRSRSNNVRTKLGRGSNQMVR